MNRTGIVLSMLVFFMMLSCGSRNKNSNLQEPGRSEQIEIDFREGRITSAEFGRRMIEEGKENLEKEYRDGQIEETTYLRRKAVIFMEDVYQTIAYSKDRDHLNSVLKIAEESTLEINRLIVYRHDGVITMSLNKDYIGKHVGSVVENIQIENDGWPKIDTEIQQNKEQEGPNGNGEEFAMQRPIINITMCYECHGSDRRMLGGLYVSINAEKMLEIH